MIEEDDYPPTQTESWDTGISNRSQGGPDEASDPLEGGGSADQGLWPDIGNVDLLH